MKPKIIRTAALAGSISVLLKGQLRFLNKSFNILTVSSDGPQIEEIRKYEGVRCEVVEIERRIAPLKDLKSLIQLYNKFKTEKPCIVHSITPKAGLLSMMAAYLARVPHRAHTFTGLVFPYKTGFSKFLLLNLDRLICKLATDIFPEGEGVKSDLIKNKVTNKTLEIIANGNINGIDGTFFNPQLFKSKNDELRKTLNIPKNNLIFLFVGRLVKDKGVEELVAAFKNIQSKNSNTTLLLVGPYEHNLDPIAQPTIKEIKNNMNIIEVGWQNDVRPYLSICNIFCLPSYREGFPNVLLQAGAMGKFSIASNISGANEIIVPDFNGRLIEPKNVESLIHEMNRCLQKQSDFNKINLDIRNYILDTYNQERVWSSLKNKYMDMINKRPC
ncbi:glycosyltransferase family 4 protein [Croceivirga sp. JEA036]|uniref:glycosyltransferase family 4 protein n=1 Tax=Croceivirga sp. JEA036 TaxID=2721162 RepID=UPI0014393D52|nr:glycosyltransferase family 4 protein [Croceivirga sp. JEA036]NJB35362.1 glycosyltransferase family 4 protein [Croceivirga sp. JEA036]